MVIMRSSYGNSRNQVISNQRLSAIRRRPTYAHAYTGPRNPFGRVEHGREQVLGPAAREGFLFLSWPCRATRGK